MPFPGVMKYGYGAGLWDFFPYGSRMLPEPSFMQALARTANKLTAANITKATMQAFNQSTYNPLPISRQYSEAAVPVSRQFEPIKTQLTQLSNGVTVATRNTQEPLCTVGMYLKAGSRYTMPDAAGVGHFLETLHVEGSNHVSGFGLAQILANRGASIQLQAFRDGLMYQSDCFPKDSNWALGLINELILQAPTEQHYKYDSLRQDYMWRRGDYKCNPDNEMPEYFHQAAYKDNTLGLPLFCDEFNIDKVNGDLIKHFFDVFYQPQNITVVGVGVDHEQFVKDAEVIFGRAKKHPEYGNIEVMPAHYTGGEMRVRYDFGDGAVHLGLCFETENWKSPDLMALCVLNMMMGGGGAFSAGGPGKGMYTRLYRNALGAHHWVNHISCSHSLFDDSGIFCFYASSPCDQTGNLLGLMCKQAVEMVNNPPTNEELNRAKNGLAANICYEYENRQVVFEDIARQVQVYGDYKEPESWMEQIMKVTADDVTRVARKMLTSKPTVVAVGPDLTQMVPYSEVEAVFKSK